VTDWPSPVLCVSAVRAASCRVGGLSATNAWEFSPTPRRLSPPAGSSGVGDVPCSVKRAVLEGDHQSAHSLVQRKSPQGGQEKALVALKVVPDSTSAVWSLKWTVTPRRGECVIGKVFGCLYVNTGRGWPSRDTLPRRCKGWRSVRGFEYGVWT